MKDAQKELQIRRSTPIPIHEIIQLFRVQTPVVKKQYYLKNAVMKNIINSSHLMSMK